MSAGVSISLTYDLCKITVGHLRESSSLILTSQIRSSVCFFFLLSWFRLLLIYSHYVLYILLMFILSTILFADLWETLSEARPTD